MTDQISQVETQAAEVDQKAKVIIDWEAAIHHELKAINSKLSWFVLLSILAIFGEILRFLLGR